MPVTATNNSNHQEPAAANIQQPAASSLLPTDETFLSVGFQKGRLGLFLALILLCFGYEIRWCFGFLEATRNDVCSSCLAG